VAVGVETSFAVELCCALCSTVYQTRSTESCISDGGSLDHKKSSNGECEDRVSKCSNCELHIKLGGGGGGGERVCGLL
jgi:hypothetical protein